MSGGVQAKQKHSKNTSSDDGSLQNFFQYALTWEDKALCSQAKWFLYSPTQLPFNTFRDDGFKTILQRTA